MRQTDLLTDIPERLNARFDIHLLWNADPSRLSEIVSCAHQLDENRLVCLQTDLELCRCSLAS